MKSATKAIACKPDHSQVASAAPADKVNNFLNLARQKQKKKKRSRLISFQSKDAFASDRPNHLFRLFHFGHWSNLIKFNGIQSLLSCNVSSDDCLSLFSQGFHDYIDIIIIDVFLIEFLIEVKLKTSLEIYKENGYI